MSDLQIYLIVIICLIAAIIPVVIIGKRRRKEQLEEIFGGRQELSERDFYEQYFEAKGVPFYIVKKIREIMEEVLNADLSRLSAKDDLAKKLDFFWQQDSLADVEMFEKFEEEFNIKFHQSDFKNLQTTTIDDIVNIVWQKIQELEKK